MTSTAEHSAPPGAPPPSRASRLGLGFVLGTVVSALGVLALLDGGGWLVLAILVLATGFAFSRRTSLGLGMLLGSVAGGVGAAVVLIPIAMVDRDPAADPLPRLAESVPATDWDELVPVEREFTSTPGLSGVLVDNRTSDWLRVSLGTGSVEKGVGPGEAVGLDVLDGCQELEVVADRDQGPVGTRETVCPGEVWQIVPYVPGADVVEPGGPLPPAAWFDGMLRVTQGSATPLQLDDDAFVIVNASDRSVVVRDMNGWVLARIPPDRAVSATVTGCVDVRIAAESGDGRPVDELPRLCAGDGWYLNGPNDATMIEGSRP